MRDRELMIDHSTIQEIDYSVSMPRSQQCAWSAVISGSFTVLVLEMK
jgi:hypothetical protein